MLVLLRVTPTFRPAERRRLADDYHVDGLDWTPDEIKYFVDGVVVRRVENTRWHQPLHRIFDSETMPDWFGMPQDKNLPSLSASSICGHGGDRMNVTDKRDQLRLAMSIILVEQQFRFSIRMPKSLPGL